MKNMFRALCFALSMVAASATAASFDRCDVVGSYINIRTNPDIGPIMDQLQLHADGTAWFNQSTAFNNPITSGVTSPAIGTWQLKKDIVVVTLIDFYADPTTTEDCCDIITSEWDRSTQEYRVVDKNTIETVHRTSQFFPSSADLNTVLTGQGTVYSESFNTNTFKKVPIVLSDLN